MGSIFAMIKTKDEYEFNTEVKEIDYLYFNDIPTEEELEEFDYLINKLVVMYRNKSTRPNFHLKNSMILWLKNKLLKEIEQLVESRELTIEWLKDLTEELVFNGDEPWKVKLGIILAKKYATKEKRKEIVLVYSKNGEYIFYLEDILKELKMDYYLLDLGKKTGGSIRLFCYMHISLKDKSIAEFMLDEGYKDDLYEDLLTKYIFRNIEMEKYLNEEDLIRVAYFLCSYLKENSISNISRSFLSKYLLEVSKKEDNIIFLYSVLLIKEGICEENSFDLKDKFLLETNRILERTKWLKIFEKAVIKGEEDCELILSLGDYYNYQLVFKDLEPYLNKNYKEFSIYYYLVQSGEKEDKLKLLKFFQDKFNISKLIGNQEDIEDKRLGNENIEDMIFSVVLVGCRALYPQGKDIALKGIKGNVNAVRRESMRILRRYRDKLTDEELKVLEDACHNEPNNDLKIKIEELIYNKNLGKKEFINIEKYKLEEHVEDIYLITTKIAGVQFRHKGFLESELEDSKIFYLIREENNPYDDRAIRVVGESGFVVGYISRDDNLILNNMIIGNKYLYGKVESYDVDKNYIKMSIFQSYKDVIDAINNTICMIGSIKNGGYLN